MELEKIETWSEMSEEGLRQDKERY